MLIYYIIKKLIICLHLIILKDRTHRPINRPTPQTLTTNIQNKPIRTRRYNNYFDNVCTE